MAHLQGDKGRNRSSLDGIRPTHHGRLGYVGMTDQGAFHLHGPQPVPSHIDHIIHSPHHPEITILIYSGPIARKITPSSCLGILELDITPVLLLVSFRIAIDRPEHRGPGLLDH